MAVNPLPAFQPCLAGKIKPPAIHNPKSLLLNPPIIDITNPILSINGRVRMSRFGNSSRTCRKSSISTGFNLFRRCHSFRVFSDSSDGGNGGTVVPGKGFGGGGDGGDGEGGKDPSFLSWYMVLLEKYPVVTKALTSGLLNLLGDLICQIFIERASSIDLKRISLFSFLGMVLVGPTLHFWYLSLSKLVSVPGGSGAFVRLLLDQFVFSPAFLAIFLAALTTLQGRPSEVLPKLNQEWFSTVVANWKLWIPFQFLNFLYVPQQLQVLAANVIAVAWNVILSYKAHKHIVPE